MININSFHFLKKSAFLSTILLLLFFSSSSLFAQDDCTNIDIVAPQEICPGDDFLLDLTFPIWDQYTIDQTGTFSPLNMVGTPVILGDDEMTGALPIGFTFNFFGTDFTEFYISSNGFLAFDVVPAQIDAGCCAGQAVPDPNLPNNVIAFAWEDLDPSAATGGGTIQYYTTGTAPNRILVVDFIGVEHMDDPVLPLPPNPYTVTSQVQLYETTNAIEMHTTEMDGAGDGGPHTMGIENGDATVGLTPAGRNEAAWTAMNDFVSYTPNGFEPCAEAVVWTNDLDATQLIGRTQTVNPQFTTVYTATADCGVTCTRTVTVTVDATPPVAVCQDFTLNLDYQGLSNIDLGSALDFDGMDDYVSIPDGPDLQFSGNITVEAWIKPAGVTGGFNVIASKLLAGVHGFWLNLNTADLKIRWIVGTDIGNFEEVTSNSAVPLDEWTHVAAVYDGANLQIFINGVADGSIAYAGGMNTIQGENLTIGTTSFLPADPTMHNFWGAIDEVRVWNAARTEAEIAAFRYAPLEGLDHQPQAYWSLNDGTGSLIASGLTPATDGVLVNMDENTDWIDGVNPLDNGSSDLCGIMDISPSTAIFDCSHLGQNVVTLTVTDVRNNTDACTSTVTVLDELAPHAVCQDITVQLDITGNISIVGADVDNGSTDNCTLTFAVTPFAFICDQIGTPQQVRMTAGDESGNEDECTAIITVQDNIPPNPVCQNITIELDNTGNVAIVGTDIDGGSTDNCAITFTVVPNAYTCTNLGDNVATLSVADQGGNVTTCTSTVHVEDNILPTPKCMDITIELDNTGNVAIVPSDVDNGSTDNCDFTLTVQRNAFTCADIGGNTITLTAVDEDGNVNTCNSVVTVQDNIIPTPKCQDITIQLDVTGSASILPSDVDNGTSDNCAFTLSVAPIYYACSNVGGNIATLSVIDEGSNTAACTATVTVQDNVPPDARCKNITVEVDAMGNVSIVGSDVDNDSSDACGIANLSVEPDSFTCADLGDNPVGLTVTDVNNNTARCNAVVTVEDNIAPTITCSEDIRECVLDNFAFFDLPVAEDNCEVVSVYNIPASGSTFPVGDNVVTGYAVDIGGNTSTCTFLVSFFPLNVAVTLSDYNGYGVSCANGMDGTATATPDGGFPPYTYEWSDGQTTQTATDLSAGFYSVIVTDDNACTVFGSAFLTGTPTLNCAVDVRDVTCFGFDDGALTAMPSGGAGNYAISWAGPNNFASTAPQLDDLLPGDYTLVVTDANNCECTNMVTVEEPEPLELNTTLGSVETGIGGASPFEYTTYMVEICGGVQPYNLTWATSGYVRYASVPATNGCMTLEVRYVDEAMWSLTVSDANGCADQATVFSDEDTGLPEIVATDVTAAESNCLGGAIDLVVENGMPPYTYTWSGPASWTPPLPGPGGSSITGLPSGWYEVVVTDSGNPPQSTYGWSWVPCGSRGKTFLESKGFLNVSPNPVVANTQLTFSIPTTEAVSLRVYDITGKQVAQIFEGVAEAKQLYQLPFYPSDLPSGIYVSELQTASGEKIYQKLVIGQ